MKSTSKDILIRKAESTDSNRMLELVDALADYEKLERPDRSARKRLIRDCFGDHPRFEALLAIAGDTYAGYAFYFETYSSFLALPTMYLEDLFVLPEFRGQGIGLALFRQVADEGWRRGCGRMEWTVLDWNRLAIEFYRSIGAKHMNEWQLFRLVRSELETFLRA